MANWLFELDLKDIWAKASKETEQTWMVPPWFVEKLGTRLGVLLTKMEAGLPVGKQKMVVCEELRSLIKEIDILKTSEGIPKEDFDLLWSVIYDWADTRVDGGNLCWINKEV